MTSSEDLKPNSILRGPLFPEPVQLIVAIPMGVSVKLVGKGLRTGQVYEPILSAEQIATLELSPDKEPFDGDAARFRLGVEAMRLGLAYEYDPYFTLSIARVDPLPHQLEAVYDYFLKLPRIRFLLADDPGAGKTIMAGLLIKELKIRGLVKRTLIVTPANPARLSERITEPEITGSGVQTKFCFDLEAVMAPYAKEGFANPPFVNDAVAVPLHLNGVIML